MFFFMYESIELEDTLCISHYFERILKIVFGISPFPAFLFLLLSSLSYVASPYFPSFNTSFHWTSNALKMHTASMTYSIWILIDVAQPTNILCGLCITDTYTTRASMHCQWIERK